MWVYFFQFVILVKTEGSIPMRTSAFLLPNRVLPIGSKKKSVGKVKNEKLSEKKSSSLLCSNAHVEHPLRIKLSENQLTVLVIIFCLSSTNKRKETEVSEHTHIFFQFMSPGEKVIVTAREKERERERLG